MEDVIGVPSRAPQFGHRHKPGAAGSWIKALVDAEIGLEVLLEFRQELPDQNLGSGDFLFAERIKNTHSFAVDGSQPDGMGENYFRYCVGCGPFSSISRSQMAPSRV